VEFKTREIAFILVLGVLISSLGMCSYIKGRSLPANIDSPEQVNILVHVAGYVLYPDVYSLPHGSRVMDAIAAAGGAMEDADLHRLNLADYVKDGGKITVPGKFIPSDSDSESENNLVNINTADQKTLETLPGIGPARALQIIEHRDKHGYFSTIEEIINVNMIGPKIFQGIESFITTGSD